MGEIYMQGCTLGGVWGGVTPPPIFGVQNSFKIVEKVGPISRSQDV